MALAAAACSDSAPHAEVVTMWAMGREGQVVTELVAEFERTHPGIRVRVQKLPWLSAHEKLLTAFVGESTPDIAQLGNTWIPELAVLGALEPLGQLVEQSPVVDEPDYFDGIWSTNQIAGTLYGVPWYVDTRLLFYRRDLLTQAGVDEPPSTWAEWTLALGAIQKRAGDNRHALLLPLNEAEPLLCLALQHDVELLRDSGRYGNFRSDEFRQTLSFYIQLFADGLAMPVTNLQISNLWTEFGRGSFAFMITGPWNIGELDRRLPAELRDAWTTAPLPGPNGPGASMAGGSSLVLFRASSRKKAAWQLIEYLSRPSVQERFFALTGNLPPRRSAWTAGVSGDTRVAAFRDQLERVKPTPKVPEWERIATEMRLMAERTVRGDLSVDQAVIELDARADRILEKRRWMMQREANR